MTKFWNKYDVSIILSSWNHPENIWETIDNLLMISGHFNAELIYVDNRNDNYGIDPLHSRGHDDEALPFEKWVKVSHSTGCGGGWLMGATLAEGRNLLFVDDKCILPAGTLQAMLTAMDSDPLIKMVGVTGGYRKVSDSEVTLQRPHSSTAPIIEVDEVSGFLWLADYEAFAKTPLDIRIRPAGWEETDVAFGIRSQGYKVVVVTGQEYSHTFELSAKTAKVEWLDRYENTRPDIDDRNKAVFFSKWANFSSVTER